MNDSAPSPIHCPRCGAALPSDAPEGLCPRCLAALHAGPETAFTGAEIGASQAPLPVEELAPHFPQLEILECLGRGGMGVVYKARQKSLNRVVALKLLAPERVRDATFAGRFTEEAHALAKLNHPHIVTVYDFGEAGGFYYLLMEFVDGVNLRQAMKAGRFTPEQALAIVPPVCEALQYAHEHGIMHRDIKPENLLLDKEGRVKIADFGIAKMLDVESAGAGIAETEAGTPEYMAPEQKEHRRTDHRADIYSLGVVLYEMLTGELPADKILPPSSRLGGIQIHVRLDEIVLRALEKTPELRYQTAADFRTQVETITVDAGKSGSAAPKPAISTAPSKAATPDGPRFSRVAIAGAVWACLLFPMFLVMFTGVGVSAAGSHGPAWWEQILAVTLLPLGATAPLGATILGWVGVTQIRRAPERLYGLGLAVFDGLLFPLLALDAVIYFIGARGFGPILRSILADILMGSANAGYRNTWIWDASLPAMAILFLVLCAAADLLIIRSVWRVVRMDVSPGEAQAVERHSPSEPKQRKPWLWIGGITGSVILLLPFAAGIWLALSYRGKTHQSGEGLAAASAQTVPAPSAIPTSPPSTASPAPTMARATPALSSVSTPAPPNLPTPQPTTQDIQREALLIQLRQATEAAGQCEARYRAGSSDASELVAAKEKVELLKAQIAGDPARAASVRLEAARQQAGLAEARYNVGAADQSEVLAARAAVELREAEISGDAVQIASVRLAAAERQLEFTENRWRMGAETFLEVEAARNTVELRRAELRDAKAGKHHAPSSTPTPR